MKIFNKKRIKLFSKVSLKTSELTSTIMKILERDGALKFSVLNPSTPKKRSKKPKNWKNSKKPSFEPKISLNYLQLLN